MKTRVCLFSGGADSLAGAIEAYENGQSPLLVSHTSTPVIHTRQDELRKSVVKCLPEWSWPHLNLWANREQSRAVEHTQRSRAFLYLSLATTIGYELGVEIVHIPENGIISLNIPKAEQAVGAKASRSTHPRFISEFQGLIQTMTSSNIRIINPFLLKTKAEVLKVIHQSGFPELLKESVSCAHTRGRTKAQPHCGKCSQCIDRRFAAEAADLSQFDPVERYEVDPLFDPLDSGGRQQLEAYVRFARRLEMLSDEEFFLEFSQIPDAIQYMGSSAAEASSELHSLHQRWANETLSIIEKVVSEHAQTFARGEHSQYGLLELVSDRKTTQPPATIMAEEISQLFQRDLPVRFQSRPPEKEKELQDTMDAALKSAALRLRREGPSVTFSVIETTPDFSSDEPNQDLYIEAKLVKDRASLRYAVKSIGEASSYYVQQGAWVLFVVYDTDRNIVDDEDFAEQFDQKDCVQVSIIR